MNDNSEWMGQVNEILNELRGLRSAMYLDKKLKRLKCSDSFLENRIKIIDDAMETINLFKANLNGLQDTDDDN